MEYNRLNIENQNAINAKAKTKADGIYTFRGIDYKVKDGRVVGYAVQVPGQRGEIIQSYGAFNTVVGYYDTAEQKKQNLKKVV